VTATTRDRILARLAAAPARGAPAAPDVAGFYAARRRAEGPAARIARFKAAIEAAHAEVHDTDAAGWPDVFARVALAKGLSRILVGAGAPPAEALASRLPAALELVAYDRPIEAWRDELFDRIDASLTLAKSAIAETGSLVLWPDAREPRLMSLVPPVHFVVLDAATIHADLHAAVTAERWAGALPTNALLVSGPSKTADIQQVLAYGAHGPRELVVLLCHPGAGSE
jgi:L-lactate dehydrogenase complex protein LldG